MTQTIGYIRVSTKGQDKSGLGREAQEALILGRYPDAQLHYENASAKHGTDRPVLDGLLSQLDLYGGTLVVAKLDRLARSTVDFGTILSRAAKRGWTLVMLDLGVDTSTPVGTLVANVIAAVAQFERDIIAERTTSALAAKRARGEKLGGVNSKLEPGVQAVLARWRARGDSYAQMAKGANMAQLPSPTGAAWTKESVRAALRVVNVTTAPSPVRL